MKLSPREIVLAWLALLAALFAGTYLACKPRIALWKEGRERKMSLVNGIRNAERLISQQGEWEKRLGELRKSIQPLPAGRSAENHLKRTIGDIASAHNVTLRDRRAGAEKTYGGLHVLPIMCPWEGDTEGIVKLLFALQSHAVMLDTRELAIRSAGKGALTGSFTVNCVYTGQGNDK